jgi:hypothetical protein
MNCRRVEQLLSQHLEGLLPTRVAGAVEAHLADCPDCRRRRDSIRTLESQLHELPALLPLRDIERRAVGRWMTERELAGLSSRRWFLPRAALQRSLRQPPARLAPLGAATAVLLLLSLGLMIARQHHGRPRGQQGPSVVVTSSPGRSVPQPGPHLPLYSHEPRVVANNPVQPRTEGKGSPVLTRIANLGPSSGTVSNRPHAADPSPRAQISRVDDLVYVNCNPETAIHEWVPLRPDEWEKIEARVRHSVQVRDDFVQIPFPRLVSTSERQIARAVESYKREAAIVDPRLSREVTCAFKATALSDLCDRLRADTGIQLVAGNSVADEKVTLFCEKTPLREVMRQLSRPFGYTWLRSGAPPGPPNLGGERGGSYRYELAQDLKSQLLEEELRNHERNAALLALEREIDQFRPFLSLSPDEVLARAKTAPAAEKPLLEKLAGLGWGPIQMYFRLSPQQQAALRAGQTLTFSEEPKPGEYPLPRDLARGALQCQRTWRVIKYVNGGVDAAPAGEGDTPDPKSVPLTAVPEVHAMVSLSLSQGELGQFTLDGGCGFFAPPISKRADDGLNVNSGSGPYAVGTAPGGARSEGGLVNPRLARDPALRQRVSVQPRSSCDLSPPFGHPSPTRGGAGGEVSQPKVTTADVLEALHRATSLPIVADFYTRLYKPEPVSLKNQPLSQTLNQLAEAMRLRWNKEEGWLQFRSATYYHDRLKEVPNRLLTRWAAARRQQGILTLDQVIEIAQLTDQQLDGAEMAEGAMECWGLKEWRLVRSGLLRPHVRFLASFTPEQRQEMMSAAGLPFTRMSLGQQQQGFLAGALFGGRTLQSLDDLAGATLRVDYSQPGWYQWLKPGDVSPGRWAVSLEPGPKGRRALMPPVRERTPEAALRAARRAFPSVTDAMLAAHYPDRPDVTAEKLLPQPEQIAPTELDLVIVYIPGTTNAHPVRWWRVNQQLSSWG